MSFRFSFRAIRIFADQPPDLNSVGSHASLQTVLAPVADPASDAFNNVRFLATGAADEGLVEFALFTARARPLFRSRPRERGRLTAAVNFTAQGAFSLVARRRTWFFDRPGFASFLISIKMRVRVVARNGAEVLDVTTDGESLFFASASGEDRNTTRDGTINIPPFGRTVSRSFATVVTPTDRIDVRARYEASAIALDGAESIVDFGRTTVPADFSDGLDSPFGFINIT